MHGKGPVMAKKNPGNLLVVAITGVTRTLNIGYGKLNGSLVELLVYEVPMDDIPKSRYIIGPAVLIF